MKVLSKLSSSAGDEYRQRTEDPISHILEILRRIAEVLERREVGETGAASIQYLGRSKGKEIATDPIELDISFEDLNHCLETVNVDVKRTNDLLNDTIQMVYRIQTTNLIERSIIACRFEKPNSLRIRVTTWNTYHFLRLFSFPLPYLRYLPHRMIC
jgi:hypothetical protein